MPNASFHALVAASTLADALVAGGVLFGAWRGDDGPPGPIGLGRVLLAALATGTVFAVKLPLLFSLGVRPFGAIRLAYVDLVVLVPLIGLALLLAGRLGRLTRPARVAAWAGVGMAGVGIYATEIEPFRLRLETASAPASPRREGRGVVRIGVLTDLQTDRVGEHERRAVDLLMAQRPDVILLPGDVFQGSEAEFERERPALRDLLRRLSAPGGVYLVPGDVDRPPGRIDRIAEGTHITPLVNEIVRTTVGDRRLTIGGVELEYDGGPAREMVHRLESEDGAGDLRILLAHRPDVSYVLRPGSRVDLVVAGHTHGGQVVVPFFGPPMTLSRVPRAIAAGGLHSLRGNLIYISRGVGCERNQAPRIRFLCPPEVSLVTLGARP